MALTRYRNGNTIFTEDVANALFGGLYGSPRGNTLDEDDPRVAGHVHDGEHADGHAQKINLADHVTGALNGLRIQSRSINENKIDGDALRGTYVAIFENASERLSDPTTYTEHYLYRKSLQLDTMTEYVLTSISPTVWTSLGEGVAESYLVLGMSNTFPIQVSNNLYDIVTVTFPSAPGPMLVKKLQISEVYMGTSGIVDYENIYCFIDEIRVNGVALNTVGLGLAQIYTKNAESGISLNIPLDEDDDLEIDMSFSTNTFASVNLLYVELPTEVPDSYFFLGKASSTSITASSTKATATITVSSAPLSGSGTIVFSNRLLSGTSTLSQVSGTRGSGSNNFDYTIGTTGGLATEIAAAINDSANNIDDYIFSASALSNVVTVTAKYAGPFGNYTDMTENITGLSVSSFSGGTLPSATTITLQAAPADGTIVGLSMISIDSGDTVDSSLSNYLTVTSLKIDGGANMLDAQIPGSLLAPNRNINSPLLNIALSDGEVLTIDVINSYHENITVVLNAIVKYSN